MDISLLYRPVLHGALGYWDEIINLIPIVIGVLLLVYLYRASRRGRAADDDDAPDSLPEPESQATKNQ